MTAKLTYRDIESQSPDGAKNKNHSNKGKPFLDLTFQNKDSKTSVVLDHPLDPLMKSI